ncbi:hypothetical protein GOP47_0025882 [Adiantum capillus-veneris]|uniref:Leucine-rich repeat-containing N-terminal plant-type domain-containing protein n=1 Tax=Adiantum capillus-veneris TaxID=13818 RepID=A0A9D4U1A9_ADICA|nr:hypothetical protein GOP47_0025882 [Adiantum capillus-veneris]
MQILSTIIAALCLLVGAYASGRGVMACEEEDKKALLSFCAKIVKDPMAWLSSWDDEAALNCEWRGVECESGRGTNRRRIVGLIKWHGHIRLPC